MSGPKEQQGERLRAVALSQMQDAQQEPAARPRLTLRPGDKLSVRIVSALLRCTSCKAEWHGNLNQFGAVVGESARCPKCSKHSPPPAAA